MQYSHWLVLQGYNLELSLNLKCPLPLPLWTHIYGIFIELSNKIVCAMVLYKRVFFSPWGPLCIHKQLQASLDIFGLWREQRAVLVNLFLLASPPFWFSFYQSQKTALCCHMTSTWPRWPPRKGHLEKFKFTIFMVKCIFSASATGTNLSLSRSPVNQVKGIYCLRSELTF